MHRSLIMTVLFLCFCNGLVFAGKTLTNDAAQGNHGYVNGSPSPQDDDAAPRHHHRLVQDIASALNNSDAWIKENLW